MITLNRPKTRRILVTGADGYIGAVLTPRLLAAGHEVTGLDSGFYRRGWLFDDRASRPLTISRDMLIYGIIGIAAIAILLAFFI